MTGFTTGDGVAFGCIILAAIFTTFGFLIRKWIGNPAQKIDVEEWQRAMDMRMTALESWSRMHVEVSHRGLRITGDEGVPL